MSKLTGPGADLIYRFVHCVDQGLITANEQSSAPGDLADVAEALKQVLGGKRFEKAFDLKRKKDKDPWVFATALAIHPLIKEREKWVIIHITVNRWREACGQKPLSETRMITLYNEHKGRLHLSELLAEHRQKLR
jgi:hypothetical protein